MVAAVGFSVVFWLAIQGFILYSTGERKLSHGHCLPFFLLSFLDFCPKLVSCMTPL